MKKRIWLTALLICVIALLPHQRLRAQQKPQWVIPVVCGVFILGVGAWITYSLYKVCQKIPPPPPDDQPDPPPPPNPPNAVTAPNTALPPVTMALDDNSGVLYWDASGYGWTDTVSGLPITQIMKTRIQSTVDFQSWNDELGILGYCSDAGALLVFSRSGSPVSTNYFTFGTTNVLNFNADGTLLPHKFYRLAAP